MNEEKLHILTLQLNSLRTLYSVSELNEFNSVLKHHETYLINEIALILEESKQAVQYNAVI